MQKNSRFIAFFFSFLFTVSAACQQAWSRPFYGRTIQLPLQKIAPGTGQILIDFSLPKNHHFADEAPSTLLTRVKHPKIIQGLPAERQSIDLTRLPAKVSFMAASGSTVMAMDTRIHFCDDTLKVCISDLVRIKFPLSVEPTAPSEIKISIPVQSKAS